MRILIPGGEGYIGQVLTQYLVEQGHFVKSLDLLIYNQKTNNFINDLNDNYEFICGDINDQELLNNAIKNVDAVILLAGLVGDLITKKYPKESEIINNKGVKLVIDTCIKNNIERLIFVSTCSNYGFISNNSLAAETHELNPLSLYAKSKVDIEKYILSCKHKQNFHPTILRFATAFGLSPRMRFDLTFNEFAINLFFNRPLLVYDPNTWRPYCHVTDFARLILRVLNAPTNKISFEIFNSGGSLNNFTKKMIVDETLKNLPERKIEYQEKGSDPRNYRVDFKKVKSILEFEPEYNLSNGLKELFQAIENKKFSNYEKNQNLYGNYIIKYNSS